MKIENPTSPPKFQLKEQVYYSDGELYIVTGISLRLGHNLNWWTYDIGTPKHGTMKLGEEWSDERLMNTQMRGHRRVGDNFLMRPQDYMTKCKRDLTEKKQKLTKQLQDVERQLEQYED